MLKENNEFNKDSKLNDTTDNIIIMDEIYNDMKKEMENTASELACCDEVNHILDEVLKDNQNTSLFNNDSNTKTTSKNEDKKHKDFHCDKNNIQVQTETTNSAVAEPNTEYINDKDIVTVIKDKIDKENISFDEIKKALAYKNVNVIDLDDKESSNFTESKINNNTQQQMKFNLNGINKKIETFDPDDMSKHSVKYTSKINASLFCRCEDYDKISVPSEPFIVVLEKELKENYSKNHSEQTSKKPFYDDNNFFKKLYYIKEKIKKNNKNQETIKEFDDKSKYSKMRFELIRSIRSSFFSMAVSALCFVVVFILSFLFRINIPIISDALKNNISLYIMLNFIFLLLTYLSCYKILKKGLMKFLDFRSYDIKNQLVFCSFVCLVHNVVAMCNQKYFSSGNSYVIFNLLVILAFFFTSYSQFVEYRRVLYNFNFMNPKRELSCVDIYEDNESAQEMIKGFGNYQARIAYQKKIDFAPDFFKNSYSLNPFDKFSQKISFVAMVTSLLISVVYAIKFKSFIGTLTVLSLCSCLSFPFTGPLAVNLLFSRVCRNANINGGMIAGYSSVKKFSDVNAIAMDARILYPKECVYLHKIKGTGSESIDYLVPYLAAILIKAKSPLAPIFYSVTQGKQDTLPSVDSLSIIDDSGIEAWIQGRRILIGDRLLMSENCIHTPHRENEEKYMIDNRQITYVAFANELVCMLVTSYNATDNMVQKIQLLEDNGVNLLLYSNDSNITPKNVANNFRIFFRSVKILSKNLWDNFESNVKNSKHSSSAQLLTSGNLISFANLIASCIRLKSSLIAIVVVQAICLVLCFCVAIFLIFYTGIENLHLLEVLLYILLWCIPVLLVSKLRK